MKNLANVICMASPKGGSGKTVLTATFATFLSKIGCRVLMIDADDATNGLTLLYLRETIEARESTFETCDYRCGLLEQPGGQLDCRQFSIASDLDLVPATYNSKPSKPTTIDEFRSRIGHVIDRERANYDFIFVDAQAGIDDFSRIAMSDSVSDKVIIVSEYDPLSAAGIERLKTAMRGELTHDRHWILLNKMLPEFVSSFREFLEIARYLSPIPWEADVVRSYARRRIALDLERGNNYTLAVMKTLKSFLPEKYIVLLDEWSENTKSALSRPLEDNYRSFEIELEQLSKLQDRTEFRRFILKNGQISSLMMFAILLTNTLYNLWSGNSLISVLDPINESSPFIFLTITLGVILAISYTTFRLHRSSLHSTTEERMQRRIEYLRDRLKQLEGLSNFKLEELLSINKRVSEG